MEIEIINKNFDKNDKKTIMIGGRQIIIDKYGVFAIEDARDPGKYHYRKDNVRHKGKNNVKVYIIPDAWHSVFSSPTYYTMMKIEAYVNNVLVDEIMYYSQYPVWQRGNIVIYESKGFYRTHKNLSVFNKFSGNSETLEFLNNLWLENVMKMTTTDEKEKNKLKDDNWNILYIMELLWRSDKLEKFMEMYNTMELCDIKEKFRIRHERKTTTSWNSNIKEEILQFECQNLRTGTIALDDIYGIYVNDDKEIDGDDDDDMNKYLIKNVFFVKNMIRYGSYEIVVFDMENDDFYMFYGNVNGNIVNYTNIELIKKYDGKNDIQGLIEKLKKKYDYSKNKVNNIIKKQFKYLDDNDDKKRLLNKIYIKNKILRK